MQHLDHRLNLHVSVAGSHGGARFGRLYVTVSISAGSPDAPASQPVLLASARHPGTAIPPVSSLTTFRVRVEGRASSKSRP